MQLTRTRIPLSPTTSAPTISDQEPARTDRGRQGPRGDPGDQSQRRGRSHRHLPGWRSLVKGRDQQFDPKYSECSETTETSPGGLCPSSTPCFPSLRRPLQSSYWASSDDAACRELCRDIPCGYPPVQVRTPNPDTKPGSRDDLVHTGCHLAPDRPLVSPWHSSPCASGNRLQIQEKTARLSQERSRSASTNSDWVAEGAVSERTRLARR